MFALQTLLLVLRFRIVALPHQAAQNIVAERSIVVDGQNGTGVFRGAMLISGADCVSYKTMTAIVALEYGYRTLLLRFQNAASINLSRLQCFKPAIQ